MQLILLCVFVLQQKETIYYEQELIVINLNESASGLIRSFGSSVPTKPCD